jgi:hypothetical protein
LRNFKSDLTIMVAGTGKTTAANLKENLDDWVFGKQDDPDSVNSREVRIIFPILHRSGPAMNLMTKYAIDVDADVQVIQTVDAPMNRDLAALPDIIKVEDEHFALSTGFKLLKDRADAGDETVFLMFFDPESTYTQGQSALSDLEIIYEAKSHSEILTLNLDGMVDVFEGYESDADRIDREMKQESFALAAKAEQDRLNALAIESGEVPKKAPVARKRAAKKAVAPKPIEPVSEPQKATEDVPEPNVYPRAHVGKTSLDEFVAKKVAEQAAKKAELVPVTTEEIWDDVAKNRSPWDNSRTDALLVELGEGIAEMGEAFSKTIRTMTELMRERNG